MRRLLKHVRQRHTGSTSEARGAGFGIRGASEVEAVTAIAGVGCLCGCAFQQSTDAAYEYMHKETLTTGRTEPV